MKNLEEVLKLHKMWLKNEKGGVRANLEGADLIGADLEKADLRGADLIGADLRRANLRGANLIGADLRRANLRGANLYVSDLIRADFRGANLRGADFRGADLKGANLEGANLPMFCKWTVSIIDDKIQIGCEIRTIKEWDKFFASNEVIQTERNTEDFKRIESMYLAYKAYYENLNK